MVERDKDRDTLSERERKRELVVSEETIVSVTADQQSPAKAPLWLLLVNNT